MYPMLYLQDPQWRSKHSFRSVTLASMQILQVCHRHRLHRRKEASKELGRALDTFELEKVFAGAEDELDRLYTWRSKANGVSGEGKYVDISVGDIKYGVDIRSRTLSITSLRECGTGNWICENIQRNP